MSIFTIQHAGNGCLCGVYDSLSALEKDWPSVLTRPDSYTTIESIVNLGAIRVWAVDVVNGKVFWEVVEDQ